MSLSVTMRICLKQIWRGVKLLSASNQLLKFMVLLVIAKTFCSIISSFQTLFFRRPLQH